LSSDFDGMQPTFRHVPPSAPRFSMQATFQTRSQPCDSLSFSPFDPYLHSLLAGFNSSDVTSDTSPNDHEILLLYETVVSIQSCYRENSSERGQVGRDGYIPATEANPLDHIDRVDEAARSGELCGCQSSSVCRSHWDRDVHSASSQYVRPDGDLRCKP
jgi:hypothetical protein